jgi:hypothetical protein
VKTLNYWVEKLFAWLLKPPDGQTCWVYCPRCNYELTACDKDSFVSDNEDGVTYHCFNCGLKSLWDFDAPVPLLRRTF